MPKKSNPEESATVGQAEQIRVTSLCRNRPIHFSFRGGEGRLGPLETGDFDALALTSPELLHLRASGAIRVEEPGPPPATLPPDAATADAERGTQAATGAESERGN